MKENKYFFDTNIFLRVFVRDDEAKAKQCEEVFEALRLGKIKGVTSEIVLAEFVWTALSFYKVQKKDIVAMLKGIVSMRHLQVQSNPHMLTAISIYEEYSVKFIDALIASHRIVAKGSVPILSYDKDFDTIGLKRVEPHQILL